MQKLLLFIDKVSTWVGHAFSFFIVGLTLLPGAASLVPPKWGAIKEFSNTPAGAPPYYPFKTIIPLAGAFILVQGIVEIVRCVICLKQGQWPSREVDVQEVDVEELKKMVHVKDEDIQELDAFIVRQEP